MSFNYGLYRAKLRKKTSRKNVSFEHMSDEELLEEYYYGKNGHPQILMGVLKFLEENNKLDIIR